MSKEFLTKTETAVKIGKSTSSSEFITASEAIAIGADPIPLAPYSPGEFPIDDDIRGSEKELPVYLVCRMYADDLLQTIQIGTPVLYTNIYSPLEIIPV